MADDQQFCLRWNNHQTTLISVFDLLRNKGSMTDCTLAAEGKYVLVHKIILSACSPYFETLLDQHYDKHPILILKDVTYEDLKAMVDYIYKGEVNISQDKLGAFLEAAKSLQVKGLSENTDNAMGDDDTSQNQNEKPPWKADRVTPSQPSRAQLPQNLTESNRRSSQVDFNTNVTPISGTMSPVMGKRRRIQRNSSADNPTTPSSDINYSLNASNVTKKTTPVVPKNVPTAASDNVTMPSPFLTKVTVPVPLTPLNDAGASTSVPPESGLLEVKLEPLVIPKTEVVDNSDEIIEDLTLDDDDDDEFDMSEAGPSHGDDSNQTFGQWDMSSSQLEDNGDLLFGSQNPAGNTSEAPWPLFEDGLLQDQKQLTITRPFICNSCGKSYTSVGNLNRHSTFECGKERQFYCLICDYKFYRKYHLERHLVLKHKINIKQIMKEC